jgi:molybdenum cofactor synthesis domain-containing protein
MTLRVSILTASDRSASGEREDLSGPALATCLREHGWVIIQEAILPDDIDQISSCLKKWADSGEVDLIAITGGTGFATRDVTPEATRAVIERDAPGLVEAMRAASQLINPHAMLSRAVAGIRGRTIIVDLPGSPKGAVENLSVILPVLPHAVEILRGDPEAEKHHIPGR